MTATNFLTDIRAEVLKWLPHDRNDRATVSVLATMQEGELLARFFNWLQRLIHAHPRAVQTSRELLSRTLCSGERDNLSRIVDKIERGGDLNPHLSKSIWNGFVVPDAADDPLILNRRTDIDLLLNDWGIHHLHLSNVVDSTGFVKRDGPLLFAVFMTSDAYLLDVYPRHGSWTDQRLVEIAVRNWPHAGLFRPLDGALGLSQPLSASDRKELRASGIASPIEVDGKVYFPASLSITTAGISGDSTSRSHALLHTLADVQDKLYKDPRHLEHHFVAQGKAYPDSPVFHAILLNGASGFGFAIHEEHSGLTIPVLV